MGVDFVKPEDKAAANGKTGGYDIEYTNPVVDNTPTPKRKTSLLNWFAQPKTSKPAKKSVTAKPVTLPPAQTVRTTASVLATQQTQPSKPPADKAYAITEHQSIPAAPNTAILSQSVAAPGKAAAKSTTSTTKVELHQVGRVLPPPPPPPQIVRHPTKAIVGQTTSVVLPESPAQTARVPLSSVTPPAASSQLSNNVSQRPIVPPATTAPAHALAMPVAPSAPTTTVLSQPAISTASISGAASAPAQITSAMSVPAAPAAPSTVIAKGPSAPRTGRAPSAPTNVAVRTDGSKGGPVVVARNVIGMRGDTTNPEAITAPGLNVNLLPEYAAAAMRGLAAPLRLLRFAVSCVCCFTLVYAVMVGYEAYFIYRTEIGQQHLQELNTQILKYSDLQQKIAVTDDTLSALNGLLQGHIYWSNWFNFLESYTLPNVYFTDLTANQTGVVNLEGVAKDYSAVTYQVNAFRAASAVVQSVEVNSASRSVVESDVTVATDSTTAVVDQTNSSDSPAVTQSSLVHFTLSLHIDPAVLLYSSDYYSYEQAP